MFRRVLGKLLLRLLSARVRLSHARMPAGPANGPMVIAEISSVLPWKSRRVQVMSAVPAADATNFLGIAREEAARRGAELVGGQHLLWALLTKAHGPFRQALESTIGDLSSVVARIEERIGLEQPTTTGRVRLGRELFTIYGDAHQQRHELGLRETSSSLLLLSICRAQNSPAASLLRDAGVNLETLAEAMEVYAREMNSS